MYIVLHNLDKTGDLDTINYYLDGKAKYLEMLPILEVQVEHVWQSL